MKTTSRRSLALLLSVLFGMPVCSLADTGNDVLNDCKPMIDGISPDPADIQQTLRAAHCAGMVAGFNDMARLLMQLYEQELYCIPTQGLEGGQLFRVFLKWLEEHPAELHESARSLFISAMQASFPCSS